MSLTRKEWEELWARTRLLEGYIEDIPPNGAGINYGQLITIKQFLREYVDYVKDQVESVIGQME